MWTKVKLVISAVVGAVITALSAICYVLFKQKNDEKKRAEDAEKQVKELQDKVEVQNGFDEVQREADEEANTKHASVDNPSVPTSSVLQDLHNGSKNRVRRNKQ